MCDEDAIFHDGRCGNDPVHGIAVEWRWEFSRAYCNLWADGNQVDPRLRSRDEILARGMKFQPFSE